MFQPFVLSIAIAMLGANQAVDGTFALQGSRPITHGHLIAKVPQASALDRNLDLWVTDARNQTIRRYDVDMTKYVHLIVISNDFSSFAHVHPVLDANGHFRIEHRFPMPGLYHIYADCEPSGVGQQVFRYDVNVGTETTHARRLMPTGTTVDVDGYRVFLSSTTLRAGTGSKLIVKIVKNGRLAMDLQSYLGALAHAVFIDDRDLSYSHVHPTRVGSSDMAMSGMSGMHEPDYSDGETTPARMQVDARVDEPGTYELWLQFRGAGKLHVAAFVLEATRGRRSP